MRWDDHNRKMNKRVTKTIDQIETTKNNRIQINKNNSPTFFC